MIGTYGRALHPMRSRDGGRDTSPLKKARSGLPSSHVLTRAESPTLDSGLACHWSHVSYDINAILLQHTPDLLSILHIHASNADTAFELAATVLNDF